MPFRNSGELRKLRATMVRVFAGFESTFSHALTSFGAAGLSRIFWYMSRTKSAFEIEPYFS